MLALLAAEGGPVSQERLVNELWRDRPPIAARKALQTSVWRLRSVLPRGVVVNGLGGYELPVDGELDIARFERLVLDGGEALARSDVERARRVSVRRSRCGTENPSPEAHPQRLFRLAPRGMSSSGAAPSRGNWTWRSASAVTLKWSASSSTMCVPTGYVSGSGRCSPWRSTDADARRRRYRPASGRARSWGVTNL